MNETETDRRLLVDEMLRNPMPVLDLAVLLLPAALMLVGMVLGVIELVSVFSAVDLVSNAQVQWDRLPVKAYTLVALVSAAGVIVAYRVFYAVKVVLSARALRRASSTPQA